MSGPVSLFLCGDVMLARGVDMIQQHSCDPILYEGNRMNAHDYVKLAEHQNGPIPARRGPEYVWGDALQVLEEKQPDVRIINLETSITTHDQPWPRKGINYRMHPGNVSVIKAAKIDCCVLSNNHTADWGFEGMRDTLTTLREARVAYAGAGFNLNEAKAPAVFDLGDRGRVLVFAGGHHSSGVPEEWRATEGREGLNIIDIHTLSRSASNIKYHIRKYKKEGDIVVLSVHWGGNWGFDLEHNMQKFAHAVIKEAGVDVVHGHSSHHVKGLEVYKGKLIMYGCGDFINDYEGIGGQEAYRGDLALMYFVDIDPRTGKLLGVTMQPTEMKQLRVNLASWSGTKWLHETMSRECKKLGCDTKILDSKLNLVF